MLQILLSIPFSFAFYKFVLGIPFFSQMHILTIFLVLGVGADDVFVSNHALCVVEPVAVVVSAKSASESIVVAVVCHVASSTTCITESCSSPTVHLNHLFVVLTRPCPRVGVMRESQNQLAGCAKAMTFRTMSSPSATSRLVVASFVASPIVNWIWLPLMSWTPTGKARLVEPSMNVAVT